MSDENPKPTDSEQVPTESPRPGLKVEPVSGDACGLIALGIQASHADAIVISGVPKGAGLSAGKETEPGVWEIAPADLIGLGMLPPPGFKGTIGLTVRASSASSGESKAELLEVNLAGKDDAQKRRDAFTPASLSQSIWVGLLLILFTGLFLGIWFIVFTKYQSVNFHEVRANWEMPAGYILKPGPAVFRYDSQKKELIHVGAIDDARKRELAGLLTQITPDANANAQGVEGGAKPPQVNTNAEAVEGGAKPPQVNTNAEAVEGGAKPPQVNANAEAAEGGSEPPQANGNAEATAEDGDKAQQQTEGGAGAVSQEQAAYWSAIDRLSYNAIKNTSTAFLWLLAVAGFSGVVGVQIRSTINYIGVACFKNALDVKRWWPWYIVRPLQGFMLGLLAVLVIKAGIFVPNGSSPAAGTQWWLAIAMLVGFGAEDFTERLRLVSQALFGKSSQNK